MLCCGFQEIRPVYFEFFFEKLDLLRDIHVNNFLDLHMFGYSCAIIENQQHI